MYVCVCVRVYCACMCACVCVRVYVSGFGMDALINIGVYLHESERLIVLIIIGPPLHLFFTQSCFSLYECMWGGRLCQQTVVVV